MSQSYQYVSCCQSSRNLFYQICFPTTVSDKISFFLFLFSFLIYCSRYQWIRRKGKPAPREIAPVVVSNHVSYIDPIFFFYELFPTIVASESHDSMPFVGTIIRAMQVMGTQQHCLKFYVYLVLISILVLVRIIYVLSFLGRLHLILASNSGIQFILPQNAWYIYL